MQGFFQTAWVLVGTAIIIALAVWLVGGAVATGKIQARVGAFSRTGNPAQFYFFIGFWIFAVSLMLFASFVMIDHLGEN